MLGSRFIGEGRIQGFKLQIEDYSFRVSEFRVSGFRVSEFRVSGFRVSGFRV